MFNKLTVPKDLQQVNFEALRKNKTNNNNKPQQTRTKCCDLKPTEANNYYFQD